MEARRKEGFSGIAPSSRNMGFSSQKKQMGFKIDRLLYRPSRLTVFVLEGLVLEAAQDTLQLIAHWK